jgi:hypothetical protein
MGCRTSFPQLSLRTLTAFSVDVEDCFRIAALPDALSRESWPTRKYRVERRNTELLLSLLEAPKACTAPFILLGWVQSPHALAEPATRSPVTVLAHQLNYRQSRDEFLEVTSSKTIN